MKQCCVLACKKKNLFTTIVRKIGARLPLALKAPLLGLGLMTRDQSGSIVGYSSVADTMATGSLCDRVATT